MAGLSSQCSPYGSGLSCMPLLCTFDLDDSSQLDTLSHVSRVASDSSKQAGKAESRETRLGERPLNELIISTMYVVARQIRVVTRRTLNLMQQWSSRER